MAQQTFEVPRDEWSRELASFSAVHDNWLVSLEVLSPALGAQPEIVGMPLTGITFERWNGGSIVIAAGRQPDAHVAHEIHEPTAVFVERTASGADVALLVEAADGTRAVLRLRAAALPETVDGLTEWP
jgi:hypothetical protein